MIAAMAQWEREEIAERVSASISIRAKLGKPLNGKCTFGYQWKDKKLAPHPEEAPVRKLMYELFLEHRRKKRVARILNERGYRTRDGCLWSDTTVDRLLRDPTAKGLHRANFTTNTGDRMRQRKPVDEWIWTKVEPVVAEDVWEQCNAILEEKREMVRRIGKKPRHPFAGVTFCHCGQKMYVQTQTPKYVCEKCRNKIPIDDLEAIFCEQLKHFFISPAEVAEHIKKADENLTEKETLLQSLEAKRAGIQEEIQRVYKLYVDQKLDGEGFERFYKPLQERQRQTDDELPRLQAEVDLLKINNLSTDAILTESQDLHARWPKLTREEKQRIVESITESIIIGKDEVSINLCGFPASEELTKEQRKLSHPSVFAGE
jgi:site-specific DNA recombinase